MYRFLVLVLASGTIGTADRMQTPNLSGKWVRVSASGSAPAYGANVGWGPEFTAVHDGEKLTVFTGPPGHVSMKRYTLNGVDVVENTPQHCPAYGGTKTNAVWKERTILITETSVRGSCAKANAHRLWGKDYFGVDQRPFSPIGPLNDLQAVLKVSMPTSETLTLQVTGKAKSGPEPVSAELAYLRKR